MSDAKTTYSGAGLELSRRDLIMATAATATLAAAGAALAEPARPQAGATIETAKGIVFETNGRGERGVGLAGVLVSNGREIVRTGLDGGYSLPIEPGMAIFVVKPAGYAAPPSPRRGCRAISTSTSQTARRPN